MSTASASLGKNRSRNRDGSWLLTLLLLVALVVILVLPPISVTERLGSRGMKAIPANTDSDVKDPDGTQVAFPAYGVVDDFRARLTSVPRKMFLDGEASEDLRAAAEALPVYLTPRSPFYDIEIKGERPLASVLTVPIPNDSMPYETLDLYQWTGSEWQFIPSQVIVDSQTEIILSEINYVPESIMVMQTNRQPPSAGADLPEGQTLPDAGRDALTEIHPVGFYLSGDGAITGGIVAAADAGVSYGIMPTLRNWGEDGVVRTDLLDNLLISTEIQAAHVDAIETLVVGNNYPGIDIDYRGLDPTLSHEFTQFVKAVAERMHANGKELSLRVEPPRQIAEDRWVTGGYNWRDLGQVVDTFKVPAIIDPRAYVPGGQMDALLNWAVDQVPRQKIELVLPARSVEKAGNYLLLKSYSEALDPLLGEGRASNPVLVPGEPVNIHLENSRLVGSLSYDDQIGQFTYSYRDNAGYLRTVWIENAGSIANKLKLVSTYNLKGAVLQHMLAANHDPDIWSVVREFLAGQTPARQSSYNIIWTVTDPTGQVVNEQRPINETGFSYTPPQSEGEVRFMAAIADSGQLLAAAPAFSLALATATPAPTPTPVAPPTPVATPPPEPTPTPTFPYITVAQTVNLRSGPGTAFSRVGQVQVGDSLRILGKNEDGSWWQVERPNGKEAWIIARLVKTGGPVNQVAVARNIPEPPKATAASSGGTAALSTASTGFFGYGIQAHMVDNGQAGQVMNMTKNMGFGWVKQQVEWKRIESSPGSYAWGALDPIVNAANSSGISLLFSVVNAPKWARGGSADFSVGGPPEDPNTFANFLGALASKYCGTSVKAIEVWNEQNLHYEWGNQTIDPAAYMRLLKPAYNAIKAACPSMIVVSGALTPTGAPAPWAMDDFAYLEGMYQNGLKQYSDAIGAHPSGYNVPPDVRHEDACATIQRTGNSFNGPCDSPHHSWSFRSTMEGYRNIMVKYGDSAKRIWPTEFGWAAGGAFDDRYKYADDNDFQEQAEWTVRAYQMMKNWGFVGVPFLWNLNFRVVANGTEKAQWGIVDPGWGPLPAYTALQSMAK